MLKLSDERKKHSLTGRNTELLGSLGKLMEGRKEERRRKEGEPRQKRLSLMTITD